MRKKPADINEFPSDIISLCKKIDMPEEATQMLRGVRGAAELAAMFAGDAAKDAYERARAEIGDDPGGFCMLYVSLCAAVIAKRKYAEHGIGDKVFYDTMSCFSRFVREHKSSYGSYGFDRGWWTYRQLSLVQFRIGELEYEYAPGGVHIHVPTGADISATATERSIKEFAAFSRTFFPDRAAMPLTISSWLLSPALEDMLPEKSNIREFRSFFDITEVGDDAEFMPWVFGRSDIPPKDLPEATSLQRAIKARLLAGGAIPSGKGILKLSV